MNDENLKSILARRAEQAIPDTMSIREKIHQNLPTPTASRGVSFFSMRLSTAAALVLALIVTASVAIGQSGLIQPDRGVQKVKAENKLVQINQTQSLTVDAPFQSLNLMVDYAYADSNRVVIGYHVNGTVAESVEMYSNPTLTDDAGRNYLWLSNSGQQVMESGSEGDFTHSSIISFDSAMVTGNPSNLNLSLRLELAYITAELQAADPYGMFGLGNATFNFTVPFNPGRTVSVEQTTEAEGLAITLQQIVITPSLTRLDLCLSDATPFAVDAWLSWETPITLDVNGSPIVTDLSAAFNGANGGILEPTATCRSLAITDALAEHTGTWALSLNGFHNSETGQTIAGSWVFTFDVN